MALWRRWLWITYIQSCFQGDSANDADPNSEISAPGAHLGYTPSGNLAGGSLLFQEVIRDVIAFQFPPDQQAQEKTLLEKLTVVHEIGHQFRPKGIGPDPLFEDGGGGIMNADQIENYIEGTGPLPQFTAAQIKAIRERTQSPGDPD